MNLDRMMKSLDRFSFTGRGEGSDGEEESSEGSKITELKRKLKETEDQVNSYRDEVARTAEKLSVYEKEIADINNNVASQKAQLEASSEEKASLLRTIEELRVLKIKGTPNNEAKSVSDLEAMKTLKDELDSSKKRQISLEKVIDELEKKSRGKEDEGRMVNEKLVELQKLYEEIVEEKDSLSKALDFTNKIVEDQRIQLSSGTVKLQHQKDLISKKELERQKSIKYFEEELCTKDGHVCNMEKYIDDIEKKLEMHEQANKEREIEDQKKSQIVNMQSAELREKSFQAAQLERRIAELERDLQLLNIEHAEQEVEGRKKIATITLVLDALKNKYDLEVEHKEAIAALERDLAETTYAKTKDGIEKRTRDFVGHWRSKSFHYAKSRVKCVPSFINGKHSTPHKFTIGVGLFAVFLAAVVFLGKHLMTDTK